MHEDVPPQICPCSYLWRSLILSISWCSTRNSLNMSCFLKFRGFSSKYKNQGSGGSKISRGAPTARRRGGANLLFDQFFQKLHENEENWAGGGSTRYCLCRSATAGIYLSSISENLVLAAPPSLPRRIGSHHTDNPGSAPWINKYYIILICDMTWDFIANK